MPNMPKLPIVSRTNECPPIALLFQAPKPLLEKKEVSDFEYKSILLNDVDSASKFSPRSILAISKKRVDKVSLSILEANISNKFANGAAIRAKSKNTSKIKTMIFFTLIFLKNKESKVIPYKSNAVAYSL